MATDSLLSHKVVADLVNKHGMNTLPVMQLYEFMAAHEAAVRAAMGVRPIGFIDRKDIKRLSSYRATIWPGRDEIEAVPVFIVESNERPDTSRQVI